VIVAHGGENGGANICATKLVSSGRLAFDGDEKPTAFWNPLRNGVRQFFANRQIHAANVTHRRMAEKLHR
jgi:hypothetical protein